MNDPNGIAVLEIQDEAVRRALGDVQEAAEDARPAFREFAQYMRVQTDNTFEALRMGGTFRGVTWGYFKPQYTRKTDGVEVPAWGGVPNIGQYGWIAQRHREKRKAEGLDYQRTDKRRVVQGRKRPSGEILQYGDAMMQDLGNMRARAALVVSLRKGQVRMGPQGVKYAARQHSMRPFLFFYVPTDSDALTGIVVRHLRKPPE